MEHNELNLNPSEWHYNVPQPETSTFSVYLIQCQTENHYYVGMTNNVQKRMIEHLYGESGSWFVREHKFEAYRVLKNGIVTQKEAEILERLITVELNKAGVVTCGGSYTTRRMFEPRNYQDLVFSIRKKNPHRLIPKAKILIENEQSELRKERRMAILNAVESAQHCRIPEWYEFRGDLV